MSVFERFLVARRGCCDDWFDDGLVPGWPWRCSRHRGHRGVHRAHGPGWRELASWPRAGEPQ